jgi:hypothetical protein
VTGDEAHEGVNELPGPLPGGRVRVNGELVEIESVAHAAAEQHLDVLAEGAQRVEVLEVGVADEVLLADRHQHRRQRDGLQRWCLRLHRAREGVLLRGSLRQRHGVELVEREEH